MPIRSILRTKNGFIKGYKLSIFARPLSPVVELKLGNYASE